MVDLKDRFLKYVSFDTQSDEMSETFPSTEKQKVLLQYLVEEMKSLGLTEVEMDEHSYAMGTIPATPGYENRPVIGFISHVDTSPDMSGANIKPQIIENYDGKDIRLNENLMMTVKDFPELSAFKGHTLITTDGTTLLGADDKAGVAEIMTAAEYLMAHPEIKHGKIRIGFTPDEEVGREWIISTWRNSALNSLTPLMVGLRANWNMKTSMPPVPRLLFKDVTCIRVMLKIR